MKSSGPKFKGVMSGSNATKDLTRLKSNQADHDLKTLKIWFKLKS